MAKVNLIDVSERDELVTGTYGRPYSFQQQDGGKERGVFKFTVPSIAEDCTNEALPEEVNGEEMGVSFKAWLERDPYQPLSTSEPDDVEFDLELWWERNFYPDVQMIANDLHAKGLLSAGEHAIDIDW